MDFATASDKALQEKEAEVRLFFMNSKNFFYFTVCLLFVLLLLNRVVKKNIFLKCIAANGFSRCITKRNNVDQFSQKRFDV